VRGKLLSIVVRNCFDAVGERQKHARAGLYDRVRALVRPLGELGVFGFTLDMRHHSASVIGTDNCVGLPVSDAAFCGDNGRSLIDVDAVGNGGGLPDRAHLGRHHGRMQWKVAIGMGF
jgi:hypothetical protein